MTTTRTSDKPGVIVVLPKTVSRPDSTYDHPRLSKETVALVVAVVNSVGDGILVGMVVAVAGDNDGDGDGDNGGGDNGDNGDGSDVMVTTATTVTVVMVTTATMVTVVMVTMATMVMMMEEVVFYEPWTFCPTTTSTLFGPFARRGPNTLTLQN